jgi:hypothetical protein
VTRVVIGALVGLHVVVALLLMPARIVQTGHTLAEMTASVRTLALRPDIGRRYLVQMYDFGFASYFAALRSLEGLEPVEQILVLAPAAERDHALTQTRTADDTLVMDVSGDYAWNFARGDRDRFIAGSVIRRPHARIEVLRVEDGRPTRVSFTFDRSLDDPKFAWFGAPDGTGPWTPPGSGTSVTYHRTPAGSAR